MGIVLLFLFLALPIAEIYVIIQVGDAIGVAPTIALLILDGFLGAALARSQGRAAWERFNRALTDGRVPANETFDGAMIILGGALLLTPGFITDIVGILLLLPPTRAALRVFLSRTVAKRAGPSRPVRRRNCARPSNSRSSLAARQWCSPATTLWARCWTTHGATTSPRSSSAACRRTTSRYRPASARRRRSTSSCCRFSSRAR